MSETEKRIEKKQHRLLFYAKIMYGKELKPIFFFVVFLSPIH